MMYAFWFFFCIGFLCIAASAAIVFMNVSEINAFPAFLTGLALLAVAFILMVIKTW